MKCPVCGAENLEGKKFCGDCGASIPPPAPTPSLPVVPAKPSWFASNRKAAIAIIVVIIVVVASVGLVYTLPLSKIKVIVTHDGGPIKVAVYIDGELKASVDISQGTTTVGAWAVAPGTHSVWVDEGSWMWGNPDFANTYDVGPLSTKNVYAILD